jgi:hypothetical protein
MHYVALREGATFYVRLRISRSAKIAATGDRSSTVLAYAQRTRLVSEVARDYLTALAAVCRPANDISAGSRRVV